MALITCARNTAITKTTGYRGYKGPRIKSKKKVRSSHLKVETGRLAGRTGQTQKWLQALKKQASKQAPPLCGGLAHKHRTGKKINKINFIHQQGRRPRLDYCRTSPKKCCKCLASSGVYGRQDGWVVRWLGLVGQGIKTSVWHATRLHFTRGSRSSSSSSTSTRKWGEYPKWAGWNKDPGAALWALFHTHTLSHTRSHIRSQVGGYINRTVQF